MARKNWLAASAFFSLIAWSTLVATASSWADESSGSTSDLAQPDTSASRETKRAQAGPGEASPATRLRPVGETPLMDQSLGGTGSQSLEASRQPRNEGEMMNFLVLDPHWKDHLAGVGADTTPNARLEPRMIELVASRLHKSPDELPAACKATAQEQAAFIINVRQRNQLLKAGKKSEAAALKKPILDLTKRTELLARRCQSYSAQLANGKGGAAQSLDKADKILLDTAVSDLAAAKQSSIAGSAQ